jgi:AraC-like DNA-binding protein
MATDVALRLPEGFKVFRLTSNEAWKAIRESAHAWHEVVVPVRGRYAVRSGGEVLRLRSGEAFFVPAGWRHEPRISLNLDFEALVMQWRRPGPAAQSAMTLRDVSGHLAFLIDWVHLAVHKKLGRPSVALRAHAALEYLNDLLQNTATTRCDYVLLHVARHLSQSLTVTEMAKVAGFSRSQLLRAFKKERGSTPMAELTRLRMTRARALLTNTKLTLKEIAAEVGLRSESYLAKRFAEYYGYTPTQVRRSK